MVTTTSDRQQDHCIWLGISRSCVVWEPISTKKTVKEKGSCESPGVWWQRHGTRGRIDVVSLRMSDEDTLVPSTVRPELELMVIPESGNQVERETGIGEEGLRTFSK